MINPIIAMLYDTHKSRFHPIVYQESPLPGGTGPMRHKSKMHHTTGFATREEAINDINNNLSNKIKEYCGQIPGLCLEKDIQWDSSQGIPANVAFFYKDGDKFKMAF